jgi:hypothetical protein
MDEAENKRYNDPDNRQRHQQTAEDERKHLSSIACKREVSRMWTRLSVFARGGEEPLTGLLRGLERKIELNDLSLRKQTAFQTHPTSKFNSLGRVTLIFVYQVDKLRFTSFHFFGTYCRLPTRGHQRNPTGICALASAEGARDFL